MLKRSPPGFVLGPEHWIGLHEEIWEKIWQVYRLVNPTTFAEAEQYSKVVIAISRAREELAEKKARAVFKEEHQRKRSDFQSRLKETARQLWTQDHVLWNAEERIAGTEALMKELKVEVAATQVSWKPMINIIGTVGSGVWKKQGRSVSSRPLFTRTGCGNRLSCPTFPRRFCPGQKTRG